MLIPSIQSKEWKKIKRVGHIKVFMRTKGSIITIGIISCPANCPKDCGNTILGG